MTDGKIKIGIFEFYYRFDREQKRHELLSIVKKTNNISAVYNEPFPNNRFMYEIVQSLCENIIEKLSKFELGALNKIQ